MNFINGVAADFDDELQENSSFIPVKLLHKFSVGAPNCYVLKSCTVNAMHAKFAVVLSNNLIKVYDDHGSQSDKYEHDSNISCVKFSSTEPDVLFTSSLKGKIQVWDARCQRCVQTFYDDSDVSLKPILCFDCNYNEQIICAGTELIREDAFNLFWDRRSSKLLGGYWNSHAGDITNIHFHPSNTSWMASSSVDGLINIFDLNETSEDDALFQTINVEAAVNSFTWKSEDILSCTTSLEESHLMELENAHSILSTSREQLFKDFQVRTDCMIESLPIMKKFFIATGINTGAVHLWNIHKNSLIPRKHNPVGYILKGHTDVVRTITYNDNTGILLTGGEDGCICLWKLQPLKVPSDQENLGKISNGHDRM